MFFNFLRFATEKVVDNYLVECCSSKQTVSKIRKRLNKTLISCYSETCGKLMRYLNLVLSSVAFEWILLTFKSGIDYNNETFKIRVFCWYLKDVLSKKFSLDTDIFVSRKKKHVHIAFKIPIS